MKQMLSFAILLIPLFIGCATVVPVEPDPEGLTLVEAEKVIEDVLFSIPLLERVKITDTAMAFVDTRESEEVVTIPFHRVTRTILKSGFVEGEYQPAVVDVYYKDNDLRVHRISLPCDSISIGRKFISALKKMANMATARKNEKLEALKKAYLAGVLSREEYLEKKEKWSQKW